MKSYLFCFKKLKETQSSFLLFAAFLPLVVFCASSPGENVPIGKLASFAFSSTLLLFHSPQLLSFAFQVPALVALLSLGVFGNESPLPKNHLTQNISENKPAELKLFRRRKPLVAPPEALTRSPRGLKGLSPNRSCDLARSALKNNFNNN